MLWQTRLRCWTNITYLTVLFLIVIQLAEVFKHAPEVYQTWIASFGKPDPACWTKIVHLTMLCLIVCKFAVGGWEPSEGTAQRGGHPSQSLHCWSLHCHHDGNSPSAQRKGQC